MKTDRKRHKGKRMLELNNRWYIKRTWRETANLLNIRVNQMVRLVETKSISFNKSRVALNQERNKAIHIPCSR